MIVNYFNAIKYLTVQGRMKASNAAEWNKKELLNYAIEGKEKELAEVLGLTDAKVEPKAEKKVEAPNAEPKKVEAPVEAPVAEETVSTETTEAVEEAKPAKKASKKKAE